MSLAAATRSEATKQFTTNAWWVLSLVLVAYIGFLVALFAFAVSWGRENGGGAALPIPESSVAPWVYSVAGTLGLVFPLLFGTLMATSEFRHKLLVPTFLATPKRSVVLIAKLLIGVVMGLFFGVITAALGVGVGGGVLTAFGANAQFDDADTWALAGRLVLICVLWTLVGIGLGSLVRNQIAAVVVVLAFTQFVEPMLRLAGMFLPDLAPALQYLPGAASDAVMGYSIMSISGSGTNEMLDWWVGAIVLGAYALVFTAIGAATTWRRDVA